jgi:predicted site-specific integrase-resolvase
MPTTISGQTYYRTSEACQRAGVSKATLFRWLKADIIMDVANKDRRGWRLFTEEDLDKIQAEARKIVVDHVLISPRDRGEL